MDSMKISIVIASLNDNRELFETVKSCLENTTGEFEVIVIDDASASPVQLSQPNVFVDRNKRRIGVGPSRHRGILMAEGEAIFIVDSHCRFTPGWSTALRDSLEFRPDALICGSMLGFDALKPMGSGKPYCGATFNFFGPDKNKPGKTQVFEAVWRDAVNIGHSSQTIAAPMGACYGFTREQYLKQGGGLQYLREWGCDEQMLALKFLYGGSGCFLNEKLQVGHRFRTGKERVPFSISNSSLLYNKLFCIHTLLPEGRAELLAAKIPGSTHKSTAMRELASNWGIVEAEAQFNRTLAKGQRSERFASLLSQFGITFPAS